MTHWIRCLCRLPAVPAIAFVLTTACERPDTAPEPAARAPSPSPSAGRSDTIPTSPPVQTTPPSTPEPRTTAPLSPATSPVPDVAPAPAQPAHEPANIPPDVQEIFDAMDRAFADSTSRHVSIAARLEMMAAVRGYRATFGVDMALQFPNRMNVRVLEVTELNDPETTTAWSRNSMQWGLLSDGKRLLIKKAFNVISEAPATLDDVLDRQIELTGWGETPMINCFLKTRPSESFTAGLKRARVVRRTPQQIDLELVSAPTAYVQERTGIPATFDLVRNVSIEAAAMIPRRCVVDFTDLSREIYRKERMQEVPVERAKMEIIVRTVNIRADFSDQKDIFVIPKETIKEISESSGTIPLQGQPPISP